MPGTTTKLALPYPVPADPADVPADIQALANRLDTIEPWYATSLPGSPVDGQEVYYAADAANSVIWHLRYRAAVTGSYKWEFVGGGALYKDDGGVTATPTIITGAYADLPDGLPTIALPLAGDYIIRFGSSIGVGTAGQGIQIAPAATGLTAVVANCAFNNQPSGSGGMFTAVARSFRANAISGTLKLQCSLTAASASIARRFLDVTPIRVG